MLTVMPTIEIATNEVEITDTQWAARLWEGFLEMEFMYLTSVSDFLLFFQLYVVIRTLKKTAFSDGCSSTMEL